MHLPKCLKPESDSICGYNSFTCISMSRKDLSPIYHEYVHCKGNIAGIDHLKYLPKIFKYETGSLYGKRSTVGSIENTHLMTSYYAHCNDETDYMYIPFDSMDCVILTNAFYIISQIPYNAGTCLYPGCEIQPSCSHEHDIKHGGIRVYATSHVNKATKCLRAAEATIFGLGYPPYLVPCINHTIKWTRDYVTYTNREYKPMMLHICDRLRIYRYACDKSPSNDTTASKYRLYLLGNEGYIRYNIILLNSVLGDDDMVNLRVNRVWHEHKVVYTVPQGKYKLKRNFTHPYIHKHCRRKPANMRLLYNPTSGLYLSDVITCTREFGNLVLNVKPKMRYVQPARECYIKNTHDERAENYGYTSVYILRHKSRCYNYQCSMEFGVPHRLGVPLQKHHG